MTKKISNEELNMRIKTTRVSDTILMKNAIGLAMPYKIQNSKIYTTALICHPEGRKKVGRPKQHGSEPQSRKDHSLGGIAGRPREQQPKTGTGGGSVSGHYVPACTKR